MNHPAEIIGLLDRSEEERSCTTDHQRRALRDERLTQAIESGLANNGLCFLEGELRMTRAEVARRVDPNRFESLFQVLYSRATEHSVVTTLFADVIAPAIKLLVADIAAEERNARFEAERENYEWGNA